MKTTVESAAACRHFNRRVAKLAMTKLASVSFVDRVGSRFNVLYSLLLFRALHLLLTIVAWQHFFQNKYYVQLANVTKTGMAMPDMCNL